MTNDVASFQIEKKQQESLEEQRRELAEKVVGLQVTAPMEGRVIGRDLTVLQDQYLPAGAELLAIGDDTQKSIVVAVPQRGRRALSQATGDASPRARRPSCGP